VSPILVVRLTAGCTSHIQNVSLAYYAVVGLTGRQRQATGGIDAADRDIFIFFTVSGFEVVGSCERHGERRYSGDNRVPGVHAADSASFALHTAREK
jgi:hypothetical protein